MKPIGCSKSAIFPNCTFLIGLIRALPIFLHRGTSDLPQRCNCNGEAGLSENINDANYPCNKFQFLAGLLFYNSLDPTPIYAELQYYLMNLCLLPVHFGYAQYENLSNQTYRDEIMNFVSFQVLVLIDFLYFLYAMLLILVIQ
jgi:hypothetical protein